MENVDLLISEEAQQDMDLKSAFAPAVPRRAFFRLQLGDPRQSPGGVADGQRAHRTLLLKARIGLRAPNIWYRPHEFPGVFQALLHHGRGIRHTDLWVVVGSARIKSRRGPLSPACSPHTASSPVLIWTFRKDSWSVLGMQPQARIVHWTFGKRRAQQRDRGWPARIAGA